MSELAFPQVAEYFLITSEYAHTQPSSLEFLRILCKLLSSATRKRGDRERLYSNTEELVTKYWLQFIVILADNSVHHIIH